MRSAAEASRSGDLLNDAYELLELLEHGELHQTYRARDVRNDSVVRVSLLKPELALRAGVAKRFLHAPKALSELKHPHLSDVLSVESDVTGIPFVVEGEHSGEPLSSMLAAFPEGMPLGVAVNVLGPVIDAVAAAHGAGSAHGSLDDSQVLLERGSVPRVIGFALRGHDALRSIDAQRSDVHALGSLFYRALSGIVPNKAHTPLDELAPHLPVELCELIERCLGAEAKRPESGVEVARALDALRERLSTGRTSAVDAPSEPHASQPARPASSRPAPSRPAPAATSPKPSELRDARVSVPSPDRRSDPGSKPLAAGKTGMKALLERAVLKEAKKETERADEDVDKTRPDPEVASGLEKTAVDALSATMLGATAPKPERADARASTRPKPSKKPPAQKPDDQPEMIVLPKAGPLSGPVEMPVEEPKPEAKRKKPPALPSRANAAGGDAEVVLVAGERRLAAAFGPLDEDRIEQGETEGGALGRAFRASLDEAKAARRKKRSEDENDAAPAAPITSGAAKAKPADAARKPAPEVFAFAQRQAIEEERQRRRRRILGGFWMFFFALGLTRAVPALIDPSRAKAAELLGEHVKLGASVFAALSVVVLIQTWALQISSKATLLRPVTIALKVLAAAICILGLSFFMPAGALGPAEAFARRVLPWGAMFFFLFLGMYGLTRGLQELRSSGIAGIATLMVYGSAFVGSYMIATSSVMPSLKGRSTAGAAALGLQGAEGIGDGELLAEGDPDAVLEALGDAGIAEEGIEDRKLVGGSEEADLESIRAMEGARKNNSQRLKNLNEKIPVLAQ